MRRKIVLPERMKHAAAIDDKYAVMKATKRINYAGALRIEEIAYHRNGVCGEGFHVVKFIEDGARKIGIVFERKGPRRCVEPSGRGSKNANAPKPNSPVPATARASSRRLGHRPCGFASGPSSGSDSTRTPP